MRSGSKKRVHWGKIGMMKKKRETTVVYLGKLFINKKNNDSNKNDDNNDNNNNTDSNNNASRNNDNLQLLGSILDAPNLKGTAFHWYSVC